MLNIAYTHPSVVLVIFHYCMLQNKQNIQYDVYALGHGADHMQGVSTSKGVCLRCLDIVMVTNTLNKNNVR